MGKCKCFTDVPRSVNDSPDSPQKVNDSPYSPQNVNDVAIAGFGGLDIQNNVYKGAGKTPKFSLFAMLWCSGAVARPL